MLDFKEATKYEYRKLVQELYKHGYSIDIYSDYNIDHARERVCIKMNYKKLYAYAVFDLEELNLIRDMLLILLEELNHEIAMNGGADVEDNLGNRSE